MEWLIDATLGLETQYFIILNGCFPYGYRK